MEEKKLLKKKEKALQAGKIELLASACNSLGDFYNQHGRYSDARKEFEQEYNYYESLGKRLEMGKASRMVGEMYMLLSEFENALKHINIYLEIVQELKNKVEQQRAFATLGRAHLLHGQSVSESASVEKSLRSAEKAFIKSLLLSKELSGQITKLEQLDMQARLYLNIGVVKEHMEEFDEALLFMNRAIKICKSNDIYELLHLCYISVCLMYQYKKTDSTKALSVCNLALDVAQRLPNKVAKMCQTLIVKSEIIISSGDFDSAKDVLRKAYKMKTPDLNDKQNIEKTLKIVTAICNIFETIQKTDGQNYEVNRKLFEKLGDGCCQLLNYQYAIIYYLKTLECIEQVKKSDKEFIPIYVSLYQTYKDDKQYTEALEYLWKEYELNRDEHEEAFWTLCNIAEIWEIQPLTLSEFWKLYDIYRKAIEQAESAKILKLEKIAYFRLSKLEQKFKMWSMFDILKDECLDKGIDLDTLEEDSDLEEIQHTEEQNTPDIGEDISLDDVLDSDSETEEKEKSRSVRKRGNGFSLKRNNKGETQLHSACISGNIVLVRHLIDQGHEVNIADYAGWLPLHEACNYGHRDIVELLLDRGAISAINDKGGTSCDGITPLHDACTNGFLEVAELLIDRGANTTLRTDFGDTALNALEKWRISVNLDDFEQIQYVSVRNKLQDRLLKLGIEKKSDALTNDNIIMTYDHSMKTTDFLNCDSEQFKSNDETMQPGPSSSKRISIRHKTSKSYDDPDRTLINSSTLEPYLSQSQNKGLAELEYRAVMKSLKRPNRLNAINDDGDMTQKRRSAFLEPEEIDDDWLDDDLLPKKKKQKCNVTEPVICTDGDKSKRKSQSSRTSLDLSNDFLNDDSSSFDVSESVKAFTKLLNLSELRKKKIRNVPTSTITSNAGTSANSTPQQMPLVESGFCRFYSPNTLNTDDSSNNRSLLFEPTLNHLQNRSPMKIEIFQSLPAVSSTVSFKIKVEEELLVVPVDKKKIYELDMRWLGEEASRRYTKVVGLKPILRLMTADGFSFEETDTVSVALDQKMIKSKVVEWNTSPLAKRYQDMCEKLKHDVDNKLRLALEKSQNANSLILKDLSLTPNVTEPLFRAIKYQTEIQILDLSHSFIQNEGCRQLSKSMHTLTQLRVLNLQGNYITNIGIQYLSASVLSTSTFEEMEELSLNDNPLSNRCLRNLDSLCSKCKNLKKLNISHCGITCIYDFDLSLHNIVDFDISFNKLSPPSFTKLLTKLNANTLKSLNLNYTLMDENIARERIHDFLSNGTCENFQRLELAGCQLMDIDIYKIVQKLCESNEFEVLNLSESNKLTFPAFQYMLKNLRGLKKILLYRCFNVLNMELLQYIPEDYHIPEFIQLTLNPDFNSKEVLKRFWIKHWGHYGRITFNGAHVILSVNSPITGSNYEDI